MGRRPGRLRRGDHGSKAIYCVLYDIVAHDQEGGHYHVILKAFPIVHTIT
eukprot:NODE_2770_length_449_cov_28.202500_g2292_i0.p2 GENE.NODE_2770_length_449_cov_28.202500_g2292_i0~~NODE_2770_length_449_cov_28.202500_g2292_i0.p2  ORF type:complete len:60 (-),score=8.51 NODE_2770_length_449_cov_28.202500_g2292_i0:269-418(-)